jgi:hypothetical protein
MVIFNKNSKIQKKKKKKLNGFQKYETTIKKKIKKRIIIKFIKINIPLNFFIYKKILYKKKIKFFKKKIKITIE